jgi:hypothetical protein
MGALATERLIVPISPGDKRRVERKAQSGKMSMAEFARRALLNYDPGEENERAEAELREVLEIFDTVHVQTLGQLDRTDAALDAALAYFEAKKHG